MSRFLTVVFRMSIFFCFLLSFNAKASSIRLGTIKEAVKMGLWYEGVSIKAEANDISKKRIVSSKKPSSLKRVVYPEELLRVFKKYQY